MSGLGGAAGGMPGGAAAGLVMPPLTREKQAPLQKAAAATQGSTAGQAQLTGGDAEQRCKCRCGQSKCAAKGHIIHPLVLLLVLHAVVAAAGRCANTHRTSQQLHNTAQQRLTH